MAGIALQECRFEFPRLLFLEAIGLSLWENETSKPEKLIIEVGLEPRTFINDHQL